MCCHAGCSHARWQALTTQPSTMPRWRHMSGGDESGTACCTFSAHLPSHMQLPADVDGSCTHAASVGALLSAVHFSSLCTPLEWQQHLAVSCTGGMPPAAQRPLGRQQQVQQQRTMRRASLTGTSLSTSAGAAHSSVSTPELMAVIGRGLNCHSSMHDILHESKHRILVAELHARHFCFTV
jgi:hypothetical protein